MINTFTRQIKQHLRTAVTLLLITSITACTGMFNPYIYPKKVDSVQSTDLPHTKNAIVELNNTNDDIKSHLNSRAVSGRILNAATFGLTIGLGVNLATGAALADKSTALLALGAGSTYGASKVFFPPTTEGLYLSAYSALSCVANRTNMFVATYAQAKKTRDNAPIKSISGGCQIKHPEFAASRGLLDAIISKSDAADPVFNLKVITIENNVLIALNNQLLKDTPDADKVLAAAKSSIAIAAGVTTPVTGEKKPSLSDLLKKLQTYGLQENISSRETPVCENDEAIAQQIAANNAAAKALAEQLNAIGTPGSGCLAADQQGAEKMSVPQTVVMISPEEQQSIPVTGGLPEISWRWENDAAPGADELSVELNNATRILKLTGQKKKLAKGYTLLLTDKSVVPQQLAIQIKGG